MSKLSKFAAAVLALGAVAAQASVVIDLFDQPSTVDLDDASDPNFKYVAKDKTVNSKFTWATQYGPTGGAIGSYRDLGVSKTNGTQSSKLFVADGYLQFANNPLQSSTGVVRWDGAGTGAGTTGDMTGVTDTGNAYTGLNYTGLGGVNLAAQADQFQFTVLSSDLGFTFALEVYTDSTHWSRIVFESQAHSFLSPSGTPIPFTAFGACGYSDPSDSDNDDVLSVTCGSGGAVDFTSVGAIQGIIDYAGLTNAANGKLDLDLTIDKLDSSKVPEPGSVALVGLALAGAGVAARRRRN
ncbi:PEP-CTERM sorting domain-containing protein [Ideonella sp. DXS22W]|uniref:PEP-CTERM sorting domain-containing protein n=1 Tax=Pseudaquabacterium inlustre TaxID=2984192 RepID=A0ABU9CNB5_9BURK